MFLFVTLSPCRIDILSPCHPCQLSLAHLVTLLPCHTLTPCYQLTFHMYYYPVTLSHLVNLAPCLPFTLTTSHLVNSTLSTSHLVKLQNFKTSHLVYLLPCQPLTWFTSQLVNLSHCQPLTLSHYHRAPYHPVLTLSPCQPGTHGLTCCQGQIVHFSTVWSLK